MNAIEKYEVALTALERGLMSLDDFEKEIAPLRDVAPVVRCKDCIRYSAIRRWCKCHHTRMFENNFCSYGERG